MSKYGAISGPYFPVFGLNTEIYSGNLCIQSEYWKIRTRNNSVFEHFSRSTASQKIHALFTVASYITFDKKRTLLNKVIIYQFNYCPLVWMRHHRGLNNRIKHLHESALRSDKNLNLRLWLNMSSLLLLMSKTYIISWPRYYFQYRDIIS